MAYSTLEQNQDYTHFHPEIIHTVLSGTHLFCHIFITSMNHKYNMYKPTYHHTIFQGSLQHTTKRESTLYVIIRGRIYYLLKKAREYGSHQSFDPTRFFCPPINPTKVNITCNIPKNEAIQFENFTTDKDMTNQDNPLLIALINTQAYLATLHERYKHIKFSRLQLLARAILIPKKLGSMPAPAYPGCAYGKSHKRT